MAYTSNKEGEEHILSRLADLQERCQRIGQPCFLGFLDEFQQKVCASALRRSPLYSRFFGGYEDAERMFLCLSPWEGVEEEQFPIACAEVSFRPQDGLTHRDLLGSLMGLGLKREVVGDIVMGEDRAKVYLASQVLEAVLSQLTRVGRAGVSCSSVPLGGTGNRRYQEIAGSISSLRLDCVVAFLGNLSRTAAAQAIAGGQVSIDGQPEISQTRLVEEGEKISIRGTGKFVFDNQLGLSKKNKLRVQFRKYS
jgi:RNA-binding protein YlmH